MMKRHGDIVIVIVSAVFLGIPCDVFVVNNMISLQLQHWLQSLLPSNSFKVSTRCWTMYSEILNYSIRLYTVSVPICHVVNVDVVVLVLVVVVMISCCCVH